MESQILLSAKRLALVDEVSGVLTTPFVVQNGQVFINQAFIGDAWIKNASIANAAVDTLKIGANAVTVPTFLTGWGGANNVGIGADMQIASQSVSYPDVVDLAIIGNWQSQANDNTNSGIKVYVDGALVLNWADSANGGYAQSHAASSKTRVGAGNHTITVFASNNWPSGTWNLTNWSILFLGVMR